MNPERPVVTCVHCQLVQYGTEKCRRCRKRPESVAVAEPVPETSLEPEPVVLSCSWDVGGGVLELRHTRGWSQRELIGRMGSGERTYLTKLERNRLVPNLSTLERLSRAFEVPIPVLFDADLRRAWLTGELLADPFVAELLPYVADLSRSAREHILGTAASSQNP